MPEEKMVPEKFKDIVSKIETMSVLDLSELVKVLEEKFGVSASSPMPAMPMAGGAGAGAGEVVEEKSAFSIELTSSGEQKIQVIKVSVGRMARTAGKVKLFIIAGFLIQGEESRVDLLIAGDSLKKSSIERTVQAIEAEVGRDVTYAVMTTQEFKYRLDMCDKFVRDILDGPHEKVINKMGVV